MRKLPCSAFVSSLAILVLFAGCNKKKDTMTYRIVTPVFESKAVVYNNIKSEPARKLSSAGKIFLLGDYLFVSEADKGVHVFDNSNPKSPKAISFINIPGNLDVAVKGRYLYADLYSDMITLDISDPRHAVLVDTIKNVFFSQYYENNWQYYDDKFIVGYTEKDTTVVVDKPTGIFWNECINCFAAPSANVGQPKAYYSSGVAGSMARLVIVNQFLYAVSNSSLISVDLHNAAAPEKRSETFISWSIETVYPFNNRLFIGSAEGMFIYNIDDPTSPVQEGAFSHARACDPVVSDGEYAYVTLRTGNVCAGNSDQLDVLDVKNISQPQLVRTYPLFNPHGLGKDGNLLFVCDATEGIKIFDATDVGDLKLIHQISGVDAYDVIPWSGRLIASTAEGLNQYDYTDLENIKLLSTIQTSR